MSSKPDFICIGAGKAGTTWLYYQLSKHPSIWMPHVKELHYFNHLNVKRFAFFLMKRSIMGRHFRSALIRGLQKGRFKWTLRYLLTERSVENYFKLFPGNKNLKAGEITPSYSKLPEEIVLEIARKYPDCKIIYLMRNPVERLWSHVNMTKLVNKKSKDLTDEEVYERINKRHFHATDYIKNLENWERHFNSTQMHIGYFDELKENPTEFMNDIHSFLEVEQKDFSNESNINQPINKGVYGEIPIPIRKKLVQRMLPLYVQLHDRFNNQHTFKWLQEANDLLKD